MEDLNAYIDEQLDRYRPDRYDIGDDTWRRQIYADIEQWVPEIEAKRIAAKQIVDQREGSATRKANALLRDIGKTEQWPLDWMDYVDRPISVGGERVRLGASSSNDFRQWAIDERRRAAQDSTARFMACEGAEWVADSIDGYGVATFTEAGIKATGAA